MRAATFGRLARIFLLHPFLSFSRERFAIMREEIFGPILPIINFNSASKAIEFINNRENPLTLYLFTEDSHIQEMFTSNTWSCGMAINETIMQMSVESLPFGGVGESGMGAYHGKVKAAYSESLSLYR